jgi:hypothetical protein
MAAATFSTLEKNILKTKGLSEANLKALIKAGVTSRAGFQVVGDVGTLLELVPKLDPEVAGRVMEWAGAVPVSVAATPQNRAVLDTSDVVYCVHCGAKQPKDYKSGDLCPSCGKQAEPILSCYWCAASGPGKFCRACGGEFVTTAEFDLALLLKRDGLPKDEIPKRLKSMPQADKDQLWGRIRRGARG